MRVEKWMVIGSSTFLIVTSAILGGSALPGPLTGSPPTPVPTSTGPTTPAPTSTGPTSTGPASTGPTTAAPATTSSTAAPSATPSATTVGPTATGTASPSASPTDTPSSAALFTLGWYPADSASFDAGVIDAPPVKPQVVNYYSGWDEPFNASFAQGAYADGIETFVEMEPWNCYSCDGDSVPA